MVDPKELVWLAGLINRAPLYPGENYIAQRILERLQAMINAEQERQAKERDNA